MEMQLMQDLIFVVAEPSTVDEELEWALGYESYVQQRGPGKGAARSHGWLAARDDMQEELAIRASERYDSECCRFGW